MVTVEFEYELEEVADFILGDETPQRVVVTGCGLIEGNRKQYRICWFGSTRALNVCSCLEDELRKVPKP
jgi:hypothetical protein